MRERELRMGVVGVGKARAAEVARETLTVEVEAGSAGVLHAGAQAGGNWLPGSACFEVK